MASNNWATSCKATLKPPARLTLSEWADQKFYLSAESAAEPGRWKTLPYQRGILDAITDPTVERVSFMKSARVGATKMMNATIGYFMDQDPCPIMVVQPTVEDAKGYSREEIAPMLRDCPALTGLVEQETTKKSTATIQNKSFPGGSLSLIGANSGAGFRRVSRRVVIFDEVDGYPPSAGNDGDQIQLGIRRTQDYWNRKIIAASTPLVAGASRIEDMFEAGDQRRYFVACPHCGHRDVLTFRQATDGAGHNMQWPTGEPASAHFVCSKNGCVIDHQSKFDMLATGEWVAARPSIGHASFHIWAAYSMSPNASWAHLAAEFLEANAGGPEKLRTFVNTALGETWKEKGDAPAWERLYYRREPYPIGSVPDGVVELTAGVDVQKDRFVFEVVGWSLSKESWSIDAGLLMGDTSDASTWAQLDELMGKEFAGLSIAMLAIDSGYNTQQVYDWARRYPMSRVVAVKGMATARSLVGVPSAVDITSRGKRLQRGYKVWPVGVAIAKAELYGWLRLQAGSDGEENPPGYCHFPEYAEEFFLQLTAEHLVTVKKRSGFTALQWQMIPGRENHWLDCRVYARAAASIRGIDRARPTTSATKPTARTNRKSPTRQEERKRDRAELAKPKKKAARKSTGWLKKRR
ncbi:MAG: phage terminase large subunit family protein [Myxococcales bacterium]|nr:phage terminase large subunit family protein [Myxococcales bacterium]